MQNSERNWRDGYGVIRHSEATLARLDALIRRLSASPGGLGPEEAGNIFAAADRLANAAMWLVAHMTYAGRVDPSGQALAAADFKEAPEGHTGGSLNMAIAFVGYLTANCLSGHTRAWAMGQGHCVAAVEAVNTLTGDLSPAQVGRYDRSPQGLSRLVRDFYSYAITADGRPSAPLGSHVGPHTAGGLSEGGYLGFTSLQYIHMPLPGEKLVAFLSDGAFEEQRGSDWAPRWWRAEDSGTAIPVMILNGRRIEQRSQIDQEGGASWLADHLALSGFDPVQIDGHDPLAYAWGILEAEERLEAFIASGAAYPAPLPYLIATCVKGFGFPGAGLNSAHNLPLEGNPRTDEAALNAFNAAAAALFVPPPELSASIDALSIHRRQARPMESRNALAVRHVASPTLPDPHWRAPGTGEPACAMRALDRYFVETVRSNPHLRPRVGNPDELRSNHMALTLETLRHRVNHPEAGTPEAVDGAIITALNEEAVVGAVLGNKGGLNLAVSYEAFAMKALGALRQEIIFVRRCKEVGAAPGWVSVPVIVTSHTWENSKNEQSHQDPTFSEALLGEMSDTARVFFPVDANSAVAALRETYKGHGEIACLVVPKRDVPDLLSGAEAERATSRGAVHLAGQPDAAAVQFVAIGAYQAHQALQAQARFAARGVKACVTIILEPGRFRAPRDEIEAVFAATDEQVRALFPPGLARVLLTHTRPEPMIGLLRRIDDGPGRTAALGYISRGGTLDVPGMLFANRCTWAHAVAAAADILSLPRASLLTDDELSALDARGVPGVLTNPVEATGTGKRP